MSHSSHNNFGSKNAISWIKSFQTDLSSFQRRRFIRCDKEKFLVIWKWCSSFTVSKIYMPSQRECKTLLRVTGRQCPSDEKTTPGTTQQNCHQSHPKEVQLIEGKAKIFFGIGICDSTPSTISLTVSSPFLSTLQHRCWLGTKGGSRNKGCSYHKDKNSSSAQDGSEQRVGPTRCCPTRWKCFPHSEYSYLLIKDIVVN